MELGEYYVHGHHGDLDYVFSQAVLVVIFIDFFIFLVTVLDLLILILLLVCLS